MKNCITINKINDKTPNFIEFGLDINNIKYELKYDMKYINCEFNNLNVTTIDSVVVTFLLYAMLYGYDIRSKYPISKKLYYQLIYHVIPQINKCNPHNTNVIKIDAPLSDVIYNGKYNATGISCGVDSFTTLYEYTDLMKLDDYKLTHLVYFKTGAHDGQLGRFDSSVENKLFLSQLENVKKFVNKIKMPLIIVNSNLNEILSKAFHFTGYDRSHSLRNCGTMYLFQKYFLNYYYSDTYSLDNFFVNVDLDMAHYEKWLLPYISNQNINFYSANQNLTRFEKTNLISNYKYSYDNLLVCWHEGKNCGQCDKCIRTLITLDYLDKLQLYKNCFDIDKYYKNKSKYISKMMVYRKKDAFFQDIYENIKKLNKKMRPNFIYFIYYKLKLLLKK